MGITVHRSSKPQLLVRALGDVLADIPADPFAAEVVAVPTRGIERWLAQELSLRFGIAANIEFPTVRSLIGSTLAAAVDLQREDDPWSSANLRWHVARAIDTCRGEPWMATIDRFVASGGDRSRRLEAAIRVSGLFARYAADRPDMLRAWAAGHDTGSDGSAVDPGHLWQPMLWRQVRRAVEVPSPPERLESAAARISAGEVELDLPPRLCVYGLTRIPSGHLAMLKAIGATRDLFIFVLDPSPARQDTPAPGFSGAVGVPEREAYRTGGGHPLVSSWGRDSAELRTLLQHHDLGSFHDHETDGESPSLLGRLQSSIRRDRLDPPVPIATADRSLQIHACHGPTRQVEVLRDALLHVMSDDPTIQPRDVVVMCPDVEAYAPLVEAVFGAGDGELPDLRVRVADRAPRSINPLLVVLESILSLVVGRVGATDVLDFASLGPVRRSLGIGEAELSEMSDLATEANIRWGIDARHRSQGWDLPALDDQTWQFGLDRLLSGVFEPDTRTALVGTSLPVAGIEGSVLGALGSLAELIDRIATITGSLAEPRPVADWRSGLLEAVQMVAATDWGSEWQWEHLGRTLTDALATTDATPVAFEDVCTALGDLGAGRPTRSDHRTGQLTVCTLVPMRSVPHRVVALLGMDDEVFPRSPGRDGDDLLLRHPMVGDHDAASEDRQLLLDAVMAAGDHLIITYSGHDERTNAERPPAVPIAELLDVLDRSFTVGLGSVRDRVVRHHPLQGFDPRNYLPDGPWGFDPLRMQGAQEVVKGIDRQPSPFLDAPLDPDHPDAIGLDELARFAEEPIKGFVTRRLGFWLRETESRGEDLIPVTLNALEAWAVGDRLLRGRLAGDAVDAQHAAERRRGDLPPGALADETLEQVESRVAALFAAAERAGITGPGTTAPVDVTGTLGLRVQGTVGGIHGSRVGVVQYSRLKAKHRVGAFVRVAALTHQDPTVAWDAVVIGRGDGDNIDCVRVGPLGGDPEERHRAAESALEMLVDLWDRGMREPLPIFPETTGAYALGGDKGWKAARKKWVTDYTFPNEDQDPYHQLVHGGVAPITALWAVRPRRDEQGTGWVEASCRFEAYAHRLWDPILRVLGGVE